MKHFIQAVDDVLTPTECAAIIARIEDLNPHPAPVTTRVGEVLRPDLRNNTRVMFRDAALSEALFARVLGSIPSASRPVGINDEWRAYRYESGQYFKLHCDGTYVRSATERSLLTLMVYLNDSFEGGETYFPRLKATVRPRTGAGLLFSHSMFHEGKTLLRGVKYIIRSEVVFENSQPGL